MQWSLRIARRPEAELADFTRCARPVCALLCRGLLFAARAQDRM